MLDELAALEIGDIGLNKWSMPVLAALRAERRFSELRGELPGVSPRALTLALKALADAGMVERTVLASYPPQTVYRLADRAAPAQAGARADRRRRGLTLRRRRAAGGRQHERDRRDRDDRRPDGDRQHAERRVGSAAGKRQPRSGEARRGDP